MAPGSDIRATGGGIEQDRNEFKRIISSLNYQIDIDGKDGRSTLHKDAETIYMRLLNALYGWELEDANPPGKNEKAIDLIDRKQRIVVQVTSECTSHKINNETIKKMNAALESGEEVPYCREPDGSYVLKFAFVGPEDKTKRHGAREGWKLEEPRGFKFDRKADTIFTSDLTYAFKDLKPGRRAEVLELARGDIGQVNFPGSTQSDEDENAEELQLVLEIGCDGKRFLPTSKALDDLESIDASRMDGTVDQAKVGSVKFIYADLDLIYKMLVDAASDTSEHVTTDVGLLGPQLFAYNRTRIEKRMEQAVRFAVNDSRIDALLGRVDNLIVTEYAKSDNWHERLHANEYGLLSPYKRAFIWERVLNQSLEFLRDPRLSCALPQDQDCVHIVCACYESRNEWHFNSTIHLPCENESEKETLELLHRHTSFPCDMYNMPNRDLLHHLYPDLCWSVGRLIVTRPDEYDRITRKYGEQTFHWDNMRVGLL